MASHHIGTLVTYNTRGQRKATRTCNQAAAIKAMSGAPNKIMMFWKCPHGPRNCKIGVLKGRYLRWFYREDTAFENAYKKEVHYDIPFTN